MYYPFGMTVTTYMSGNENKFKYNGKELEDEHGLNWYHYGVRYYDPQLGRWHTMDPADEFHSPYLYVGNDPVRLIDPDGAQTLNASAYIKSEFNSVWNTGIEIRDDFTYNTTPLILDKVSAATVVWAPEISTGAAFLSLGLSLGKDLRSGSEISTGTIVSSETAVLGMIPKTKVQTLSVVIQLVADAVNIPDNSPKSKIDMFPTLNINGDKEPLFFYMNTEAKKDNTSVQNLNKPIKKD